MKFFSRLTLTILFFVTALTISFAQETAETQPELSTTASSAPEENLTLDSYTIFDDKMLLAGYANKHKDTSKEILIEMIKDDNLSSYKSAAAVRVFKEKFASEVFAKEKKIIEKTLLRRLNRTTSPFVEVEIMHTLCRMDRYRYFNSMAPALLQKLNHYNTTINEMAFVALTDLIETGNNRTREARIIFNVLRKMLFLSRKKLENISEPGPKLSKKLQILRWSIKVLGSQELKRLPKEVINLL